MRVGISGTGRIGRLILRKSFSHSSSEFEVNIINSTCPVHVLAHLLKYDSVHGVWDASLEAVGADLIINGRMVAVVSERDPDLLPWGEYGIDAAIDATGKFNDRSGAERHLLAGAKRVVVTSPASGMDLTVVMGVNERRYDPELHRLLSTASCTTNCLAPILHILDGAFGVHQGWMTAVHAYTNDQKLLDNPHKDLRRARSCTNSIIPTTTGVGKALADVLPHLAPHIQGISVRVPTQDVSLLDLQVQLHRTVQVAEVRSTFQHAVSGTLGAFVGYNELPLVSADYIGNDKSVTVDGLSMMTRGDQVKLLAWYDNEWAYACRVIDFIRHIAKAQSPNKEGNDLWIA